MVVHRGHTTGRWFVVGKDLFQEVLGTVGRFRLRGTVVKFIQFAVSCHLIAAFGCCIVIDDNLFSGTKAEKAAIVIMWVHLGRSVTASFDRHMCPEGPKVFDIGAATGPLCIWDRSNAGVVQTIVDVISIGQCVCPERSG